MGLGLVCDGYFSEFRACKIISNEHLFKACFYMEPFKATKFSKLHKVIIQMGWLF